MGHDAADAIEELLELHEDEDEPGDCTQDCEPDCAVEHEPPPPPLVRAVRDPQRLPSICQALWSLHPLERKYALLSLSQTIRHAINGEPHAPQDVETLQQAAGNFVPYAERYDVLEISQRIN